MSKKPAAPTSAPAATDELNPSLDAMLSTLSMARKGGDAAQAAAGETQRCGLIAIVGRPNVGKSTLLNALVGQKVSITSRKAQTTRHRIVGLATDACTQFAFVDTPGFQTRHRSRLNDRLNRAVRDSLADVDAVVLVFDATRVTEADRAVVTLLPPLVPVVAAVNKVDLLADKGALLPLLAQVAQLYSFAAIVPISAERGTQLDDLKAEIAGLLPVSAPLYPADDLTDRDERFLAAEFIREKIFRQLGDELLPVRLRHLPGERLGIGRTRCNRIHPDALRSELTRQALREPVDRQLREPVVADTHPCCRR